MQQQVLEISGKCGGKDRLYRNTLLFLAGTSRGLNKLRQAHRERAALEGVQSDYGTQLDEEQKKTLQKRLEAAQKATIEALGPAYTVALRVSGQKVDPYILTDARCIFQEHLGYLWATLIEDAEWILRKLGQVTLQETGMVIKEGNLRVKDAVEAFLRFTDKPMITHRAAVIESLAQACLDGLIGIGRGGSPSTLQARYCRQSVSLDASEDGAWIIPPFTPEPPKVSAGDETKSSPGGTTTIAPPTCSPKDPVSPTDKPMDDLGTTESPQKSLVHRFTIRGKVPVENYGELFRCFVGPAARMNLKKLHLGIQFEMEPSEGQELDPNDPALKAMKEAARQLGLKFEVEEEER